MINPKKCVSINDKEHRRDLGGKTSDLIVVRVNIYSLLFS